MNMPRDVIGVDVSKDGSTFSTATTEHHSRVSADRAGPGRFARSARGTLVVLEASEGYERPLTAALKRAGTEHARVNPRQAREFARATGRLAKACCRPDREPTGSMPGCRPGWAGRSGWCRTSCPRRRGGWRR